MSQAFTVTTPRGKVSFELLCGTLKSLGGEDCKVFSVVGDDPYFVPHFLEHYRSLGVLRFVFYLDRPTKKLCQYVFNQPDVMAFTSKVPFGTPFGRYVDGAVFRWHHLLNDFLTEKLFAKKWALSVDIDEFAVLPSQFSTINQLCDYLDALSVVHVGAPMVEFYSESLGLLAPMDSRVDPFAACQFFDRGPYYEWSLDQQSPKPIYAGIRQRLFEKVQSQYPENFKNIVSADYCYQPPKMWKVPLLKHGLGVRRIMKHEASSPPSLQQGLALAHFKFFPGFMHKVADAIRQSQYYHNSLEYKLMNLAFEKCADDCLSNDLRTCVYQGPESLVEAHLLMSK